MPYLPNTASVLLPYTTVYKITAVNDETFSLNPGSLTLLKHLVCILQADHAICFYQYFMEATMGIRTALRKELMNVDKTDLMTADDVRHYVNESLTQAKDKLSVISRFNEHHSQVQAGLPSQERHLRHQQHRLFKDILYPKSSVENWLSRC